VLNMMDDPRHSQIRRLVSSALGRKPNPKRRHCPLTQGLDSPHPFRSDDPFPHHATMGQQLNKIIKRKRRAAYRKRKKVAAAAAKKK